MARSARRGLFMACVLLGLVLAGLVRTAGAAALVLDGPGDAAPAPTRALAGVPIENGGFEQPAVNPAGFALLDEIPGWQRSSGAKIELQNRVFGWEPHGGNQLVELDGTDNTWIYQEVPTNPGQRYFLRFFYSPRPAQPALTNSMEVWWDGKRVDLGELSRQGAPSQTDWSEHEYRVSATRETTRLEFRGAGASDQLGAFLDDVSLEPIGTPLPPAEPPPVQPPAVTTKEIAAPAPGKSKKVSTPVSKGSTLVTAILVAVEDLTTVGLFVNERTRRIKRLQRLQPKLETFCHQLHATALVTNASFGLEGKLARKRGLMPTVHRACLRLLSDTQKKIDELRAEIPLNRSLEGDEEPGCGALAFRLRLERKAGTWIAKVAKKGTKPRLKASCELTDTGLELTLKRRGKGTLRQALGKKLTLTVRRSQAAPAPEPDATLTFSFAQQ